MAELKAFLMKEKSEGQVIYPPEQDIFNAFLHTPFEKVRVVIVGQDPYHRQGQAHGLCFSVPQGVALPPSLKNIYKELEKDMGIPPSKEGCLLSWAEQGVLLLNTTLTVRADQPKSHHGRGWECFTDAVIAKLIEREDPIVFVLWGKSAQEKLVPDHENLCHFGRVKAPVLRLPQVGPMFSNMDPLARTQPRELSCGQNGKNFYGRALDRFQNQKTPHAILTASHPSPFSAHSGFFGCRHFSKINDLLEKWGKSPIHWQIS